MSLIELTDAKTFLGIDDNDSDTEINQLIPKTEALFYSMLKVDTLEEDTIDEIARYTNSEIWCKNFPVTAINTIWGEAYTGVDFDDYIVTKNKIKFHVPGFLENVKANKVKINYTFWYATADIPEDLKLAILILVSGLYNTKENYGTTVCKIGQETINFRDATESEDFQRILKNYKKKFICVM